MYSNECLCIIACGKNKNPVTSKAEDLYTGTSFQVRKGWATTNFNNWCILSAKHGILLPNQIIDPYDVQMKDLSPEQRVSLFEQSKKTIQDHFPECNKFYLLLPSTYAEFADYLKPIGEVIFPLEGIPGRAGLHYLLTGNKETVDVDAVLKNVTSQLSPSIGYEKRYLLALIKHELPKYSKTYINRILNCSTIDSTGDKGLRFRRIWEMHDGLYYFADTYAGNNPRKEVKKLF